MIRQLRGEVVDITDDAIVLDVNGVGYLIYRASKETYTHGETVTLHTYLAVRETALNLYGFPDRDSLQIFELLLTLPKIGPKSAAQILHQADIELLKEAVNNNDASYLSKMSGIGKKTAEKIVTGLKDIFGELGFETSIATTAANSNTAMTQDAIDALITLGYLQSDARNTIQTVLTAQPDTISSAELIKHALRHLNQN